jgi:hypothetical protein
MEKSIAIFINYSYCTDTLVFFRENILRMGLSQGIGTGVSFSEEIRIKDTASYRQLTSLF